MKFWRKSFARTVTISLDDAIDDAIEKLRAAKRELCSHEAEWPVFDWERNKAKYVCVLCGTEAEVDIKEPQPGAYQATMPIGWVSSAWAENNR